MTEARARIQLETDAAAVGEELKGRVVAPAAAAAPGATVFVELLWRTSGECKGEEVLVAATELRAGPAHDAPFAFTIPSGGPMTYAGKAFSIDWVVRIKGEPSTETRFAVTAAIKQRQDR